MIKIKSSSRQMRMTHN